MTETKLHRNNLTALSRRGFIAVGSAAAAATALPLAAATKQKAEEAAAKKAEEAAEKEESAPKPAISTWRTLGRTDFEVSDIAMGAGASDSNVIRHAYDLGVNYFDTAESYGNGEHERLIGEALQHMDRDKVFITTKLEVKPEDTEQTFLERYGKCLERLKTDHADALFMHGVAKADTIKNEAFHAAFTKLKADGKVRFGGISCHGAREEGDDSLDTVLLAAVEDGRFDLMLVAYNFMNKDKAEKVLAACKKANIGTTAMKTAPGAVDLPPFDPDNPTGPLLKYIERKEAEGQSRETAINEIEEWLADQKKTYESTKSFREEHGITSVAQLREVAVKWVLQNPEMQTVCVGMRDFEQVDQFVALSGSKMKVAEARLLDGYRVAHNSLYCRHGCKECLGQCSEGLPVSTIMRYSYYFTGQGREKEAMGKYSRLGECNGTLCMGCKASCRGACPYGVDIRANLISAHSLLTIA